MNITKSPDAFRTIAEVAAELGVETHVLRFWESKFPQVKPVRMRGGRRYYRQADIETLRQIKELLHIKGFTVRGAKEALEKMSSKRPMVAVEGGGNVVEIVTSEVKRGQELRLAVKELRDLQRQLRALAQPSGLQQKAA